MFCGQRRQSSKTLCDSVCDRFCGFLNSFSIPNQPFMFSIPRSLSCSFFLLLFNERSFFFSSSARPFQFVATRCVCVLPCLSDHSVRIWLEWWWTRFDTTIVHLYCALAATTSTGLCPVYFHLSMIFHFGVFRFTTRNSRCWILRKTSLFNGFFIVKWYPFHRNTFRLNGETLRRWLPVIPVKSDRQAATANWTIEFLMFWLMFKIQIQMFEMNCIIIFRKMFETATSG